MPSAVDQWNVMKPGLCIKAYVQILVCVCVLKKEAEQGPSLENVAPQHCHQISYLLSYSAYAQLGINHYCYNFRFSCC